MLLAVHTELDDFIIKTHSHFLVIAKMGMKLVGIY